MPGWLPIALLTNWPNLGDLKQVILIISHDFVGQEFGLSVATRFFSGRWHLQRDAGGQLGGRTRWGFIPMASALEGWLEGWAQLDRSAGAPPVASPARQS